jgi:lysozyme
MRRLQCFVLSVALTATLFIVCFAQTGEFREPWNNSLSAIVIDPFEGNSIDWNELATDLRVVGIIHRGTIGYRLDKEYFNRRDEAKRRGYKWGSYHLGKAGDPVKQADFYLDTIKPEDDEVMALDIESLESSKYMSLDEARLFIRRIKEKTGRYPMIYGNYKVINAVTKSIGKDNLFSKTPLWYARFKRETIDFPVGTWNTYTLWQFSSEINCKPTQLNDCLYTIPGTKSDIDINVYNGTVDDLRYNWPFNKKPL